MRGIIAAFRRTINTESVPKPSWWSDCLLAMNFGGEAGSRTFIDYSPYRRKFAGASGAKIIRSDKKFGSGCLQSGAYDNLGTSGGSPNGFTLTGNFTVQAWIKLPVYTAPKGYVVALFGNESTSRWSLYFATSVGGVVKAASNIYAVFEFPEISTSISADVWTHIAWVRVGSTVSFYANGVSQGSYTQSGTLGNSNFFAQPYSNDSQFLIDDLTIINSAIYTANFSPPTQSKVYTGIDGWFPRAVLALGFNGANASTTMVDSSPVAVNPTNSGAIQVTSTDPAYGVGAGNFAGVSLGEHLTLGAAANSALSGDCTIEFMFKRKGVPPHGGSTAAYHTIFAKPIDSVGGERGVGIADSNGFVSIMQGIAFDGQALDTGPTNLTDGNWHHVAVCVGPITRIFVDNELIFSKKRLSGGSAFGGPQGWVGGPSVIHAGSSGYSSGINAHIDNLIISAGNHYDGSFVPPVVYPIGSSDPYWSLTTLLLQFAGSDNSTTFIDEGPYDNDLTAIGNGKIRSVSGENYLELDGNGDGLQVAPSGAFDFGTGHFTVEMEVTLSATQNTLSSGWSYMLIDSRANTSTTPMYLSLFYTGTQWLIDGRIGSSSDTYFRVAPHINIVANQRYHIAYVRSGTAFQVFLDGVPCPIVSGETSTTSLLTANVNSTNSAKIGIPNSTDGNPFTGNIHKIRVTKAARYSAQISIPDQSLIS